MVFVKKTLGYLKRSALPLVLAMLAPAILLAFFSKPLSVITFLPLYYKDSKGGFLDILYKIVSSQSLYKIFPFILIAVTLLIMFSYAIGIMEKHLKTGTLAIGNPIRCINNSIMPAIKTFPIYFILFTALILLQTGICALIRHFFSGASVQPSSFDMIWVGITSFVILLIMLMLALVICIWCVIMQIYGYSFSDALVEAMRTVSKKWFSLVLGLLLPIGLLAVPQIVLNAINYNGYWVQIVISSLVYLCILVYFSAYIMIAVFELNGLERRDRKRIIY